MRLIDLQAAMNFDLEEIEVGATDPDCLTDEELGRHAREWIPMLVKALRAQDAALAATDEAREAKEWERVEGEAAELPAP